MSQPTEQIVITWEMATRFFAIAGFVLGIFNALIAFLRGRRRFKVKMTVSERNQLRGQLKIKVINHGNLPVIIESFYLTRLPDGKGEQRKLRISVAESEKLPLTIQAGASEIFTSSIYQNINLLQAGNDVICVEASDGKIVSSSVCKDLTKIGEWMSQDEYE